MALLPLTGRHDRSCGLRTRAAARPSSAAAHRREVPLNHEAGRRDGRTFRMYVYVAGLDRTRRRGRPAGETVL